MQHGSPCHLVIERSRRDVDLYAAMIGKLNDGLIQFISAVFLYMLREDPSTVIFLMATSLGTHR